jgi:hypothetical protein
VPNNCAAIAGPKIVSDYLTCILTAVAGAETYLRAEFNGNSTETFSALIGRSPIDAELRVNLHRLRRYRNKWVHVSDPWEDEELLDHPERFKSELEGMAVFAIRVLRGTIFTNQWLAPLPPPLHPKMKVREHSDD